MCLPLIYSIDLMSFNFKAMWKKIKDFPYFRMEYAPKNVPPAPAGTMIEPTVMAAWADISLNWNSKYLGKNAACPEIYIYRKSNINSKQSKLEK